MRRLLNIASSFPLVLAYNVPADPATGLTPGAFSAATAIRSGVFPNIPNPDILVRTMVNGQFRAPLAEQFTMQFQRELPGGFVLSTGWVGTKGTGLFQNIDGNPTRPTAGRRGPVHARAGQQGVIRERCNCTSSIYHSWPSSLEKHLGAELQHGRPLHLEQLHRRRFGGVQSFDVGRRSLSRRTLTTAAASADDPLTTGGSASA